MFDENKSLMYAVYITCGELGMSGELTKFLKSEYEEAGVSPAYVRLNNRKYLVPYPYVRDYDDFQKAFLFEFFDLMRRDYRQYIAHGEQVRYISWHDGEKNRRLVVPYDLRRKNLAENEITQKIFTRAFKKYRKAVKLAADLAQAYPERPYQTLVNIPHVRKMQQALYEHKLRTAKNKAVYMTKAVGLFLSKNAVKLGHGFKNLTLPDLNAKARKWALRTMLAVTVSSAVYSAVNIKQENTAKVDKKEQCPKGVLSNAQVFDNCRDDIKVSLAFVENFAGKAFNDGTGMMTIGYGCTYYIDENGRGNREISPVKKGDTITMEEALVQKDRYLNFRILPQIENLVKVPLDKKTMVATVNFAYVIGPKNFRDSKYLEALNQGKTGAELAKYLSGFRKQKGLLCRCYFMAEMLKGNLKTGDFLNLTAEGCYNLKPEDVCAHIGKNLVTDKENMAMFIDDKIAENLKKAAKNRTSVANDGGACPKVRDILPPDLTRRVQGEYVLERMIMNKGIER